VSVVMSPGFAHIRVASISGWVRVSFVLFFMIIHLLDEVVHIYYVYIVI
jgi:hypothetical protein